MAVCVETVFDSPEELRVRRVAALAAEIGRCLRLSALESQQLEQAAAERQEGGNLLTPKVLDRLLGDVVGPGAQARVAPGPAPAARPARPVSPPSEQRLALLRGIVELAACFEQRLEFLPYERLTGEQIVDELGAVAAEVGIDPAVVTALGSLQRIRPERLVERVHRLPVFPRVALKALELARSEDSSFVDIEKLVSADQVLAGRLIQTANSSLYSPSQRIASLRQAVAYIGVEAAHRVLMASVFHPLFASGSLKGLWRHSVEISQLAACLAESCGKVPPDEAFLAGLVHDVGRLALATAQGEDALAYARLVERGCEPVFAEMVLCGFDHGLGGAGILRYWSFPEHLVEAVENHHHPEDSTSELCAMLYLAEFWSGSEEDLPSGARLKGALKRTGLSWKALRAARVRPGGLAELLASAA